VGRLPAKRYVIRNAEGQELVCPSLADLHALYSQGFLTDDDQVRLEGSERWVRAGSMPALHGVRQRRADPRKMAYLLVAVAVLTLAIALLVRGGLR
jgi:hypothetical protein